MIKYLCHAEKWDNAKHFLPENQALQSLSMKTATTLGEPWQHCKFKANMSMVILYQKNVSSNP